MEEKREINLIKIFFIILAVILAAAILVVGIGASLNSDPLEQISKASDKSESALKQSDFYTEAQDLYNKGSVGIYWNLQKLTEQLAGYGIDIAFSAKMHMNQEDNAYLMNAVASIAGDQLVDATVYIDPSKVLASCYELLGEDTYGINLTNFKENFANSVFGENGAYSLGITEEHFAEMESYIEISKTVQDLEKDAAEIVEDFWSMLKTSLKEDAVISRKKGSVDFVDQTVKTNDIVITLEAEAVAAVVEDVLVYLKDSEAIAALLEKYQEVFSVNYGIDMGISEEYRSGLEDALATIDELYAETEDALLEVVVSIAKSTKEIIGVNVRMVDGEEEVKINAICGPTWKNITEINITVENDDISELSYLVKENSKKAFDAEFKVVSNEEVLMDATATWDKELGDIEIAINGYASEASFKLDGSIKLEGKKRSLTLDSIEVNGQTVEIGGFVITVNTDDKMPSVGDYTDILTMDESGIEKIVGDIQTAVQEIGMAIFSAVQ